MTLSKPMIIFALRYCLHSATYSPAICTRYLIDHWSEFDATFQAQVLTEIQEWVVRESRGSDSVEIWERVLHHAAQLPTINSSERV